jgi:glycosyltransferase involved in cell wall biosynthesis
MRVGVVIPAFNEQHSIRRVLQDIPRDLISEVVVVDNGCTDRTAEEAFAMGAQVVREPKRGYGAACLAGIKALDQSETVVFLDADYSDHPNEMPNLLRPIQEGRADLVIGSRVLGRSEPGALLPQARFGNWLATRLIRWLYRVSFTDLGPFRAIRWSALEALQMKDETYGWTVEMQVKCARQGFRCVEVPVSYRKRIGVSKITGTFSGTFQAGFKIITTIFRYLR